MALQSYWKAHIKSDFLEYLENQLKTIGPIKERNISTWYSEAPKTPWSRLLRLNPPWLRRPLKLNREDGRREKKIEIKIRRTGSEYFPSLKNISHQWAHLDVCLPVFQPALIGPTYIYVMWSKWAALIGSEYVMWLE